MYQKPGNLQSRDEADLFIPLDTINGLKCAKTGLPLLFGSIFTNS